MCSKEKFYKTLKSDVPRRQGYKARSSAPTSLIEVCESSGINEIDCSNERARCSAITDEHLAYGFYHDWQQLRLCRYVPSEKDFLLDKWEVVTKFSSRLYFFLLDIRSWRDMGKVHSKAQKHFFALPPFWKILKHTELVLPPGAKNTNLVSLQLFSYITCNCNTSEYTTF